MEKAFSLLLGRHRSSSGAATPLATSSGTTTPTKQKQEVLDDSTVSLESIASFGNQNGSTSGAMPPPFAHRPASSRPPPMNLDDQHQRKKFARRTTSSAVIPSSSQLFSAPTSSLSSFSPGLQHTISFQQRHQEVQDSLLQERPQAVSPLAQSSRASIHKQSTQVLRNSPEQPPAISKTNQE